MNQPLTRFQVFVALGALVAASACSRPAAQEAADTEILARVNGEAITAADVRKEIGQPLSQLEDQLYAMKREKVDDLVTLDLAEREAKRRGITTDALFDSEVTAKVTLVTESEIDKYCESQPAECQIGPGRTEQSIRAAVRGRLQSKKVAERQQAFINTLRADATIEVFLEPPPVFRATVAPGVLPARGPANAPVTIIEFSDFHCPFCRRVQPTLKQVLAKYPSQVRLIYRDSPLDGLHPEARKAAEAGRCANDQGRFWEFHDAIFAAPASSPDDKNRSAAEAAKLDVARFQKCMTEGTFTEAVKADSTDAAALNVTGTPTFFVNGRPLRGAHTFETFVEVIDAELARRR